MCLDTLMTPVHRVNILRGAHHIANFAVTAEIDFLGDLQHVIIFQNLG